MGANRHAPPLRMLLVHAHPDDETTTTGATIARYTAEGVGVTLVTCTRGERGEIVDAVPTADPRTADPPTADRPAADPPTADPPTAEHAGDDDGETLGARRVQELAEAARMLRLHDVRFLGGTGAWWDSGMADARIPHPRAFADGDLPTQARQLAAVIREVRPQVLVTYDERGGYGHPDHIRAHEVTLAGYELAADPRAFPELGDEWSAAKVYAAVVPYSQMRRAVEILASAVIDGANPFAGADSPPDVESIPFGVPDESVSARIDARDWIGAKTAAMRAHRSQMDTNGWFFALGEDPDRGFGLEHYRLLRGDRAVPPGEFEDDLFAGVRGQPDAGRPDDRHPAAAPTARQ
jgi:N-acetyl-1-D-myo-inositol-2-amino-2-deoxy-alpha-D-glucopyranoside deacetylase